MLRYTYIVCLVQTSSGQVQGQCFYTICRTVTVVWIVATSLFAIVLISMLNDKFCFSASSSSSSVKRQKKKQQGTNYYTGPMKKDKPKKK